MVRGCNAVIWIDLGGTSTINKRYRMPNGQSNKENKKKTAIQDAQDTRRRKTKQKHNTICVGHHYVQTNINNVNKT